MLRRRGTGLRLGIVLFAALGAAGLAACELVLGTLPPVADAGASGGQGAGGGGADGGTTSSSATTGGSAGGGCASTCPGPLSGPSSGKASCDAGHCTLDCNTTTPLDCTAAVGEAACVDPKTDPQFCGDCGGQCAGGEYCDAGKCAPFQCPLGPGITVCKGACTDTQSDTNNCGTCGKVCTLQSCVSGTCVTLSCGSLASCSGLCVDTMTDPANCGGCNMPCSKGQVCIAGSCAPYVAASGSWECGTITPLSQPCVLDGQNFCTSAGSCP